MVMVRSIGSCFTPSCCTRIVLLWCNNTMPLHLPWAADTPANFCKKVERNFIILCVGASSYILWCRRRSPRDSDSFHAWEGEKEVKIRTKEKTYNKENERNWKIWTKMNDKVWGMHWDEYCCDRIWRWHVVWQGCISVSLQSVVSMFKLEDFSDNDLLMRQQFLLKRWCISIRLHCVTCRNTVI